MQRTKMGGGGGVLSLPERGMLWRCYASYQGQERCQWFPCSAQETEPGDRKNCHRSEQVLFSRLRVDLL